MTVKSQLTLDTITTIPTKQLPPTKNVETPAPTTNQGVNSSPEKQIGKAFGEERAVLPQKESNSNNVEKEERRSVRTKAPPKCFSPDASLNNSLLDEQNEHQLYCICQTPYDDEMFYIGCDFCDKWFHGSCIGFNEDQEKFIAKFKCHKCQEKPETSLSSSNADLVTNEQIVELQEVIIKQQLIIDDQTDQLSSVHKDLKMSRQAVDKNQHQQKEVTKKYEKVCKDYEKLREKEKSFNEKNHEIGKLKDKIATYEQHLATLRSTNTSLEDANTNHQKIISQLMLEKDTYKAAAEKLIESATAENSGLFQDSVESFRSANRKEAETQTVDDIAPQLRAKLDSSQKEVKELKKKLELMVQKMELEHEREVAINNLALRINNSSKTSASHTDNPGPLSSPSLNPHQQDCCEHKKNDLSPASPQRNLPREPSPNVAEDETPFNYTWIPKNTPEPCSNAFFNKECNSSCPLNHNLNQEKIKKGVCFHEFKKKGSCRRKQECWFSHEIPSNLRVDHEFIQFVKRTKRTKLSNKTKPGTPAEPCEKAYWEGPGSCSTESGCTLEHNLNYRKIEKGLCFTEYFQKGSCDKKSRCPFTHQIPSTLRQNEEFYARVTLEAREIEERRRQRQDTRQSK